MEDTGVIVRRNSEWSAKTKFPFKKKRLPLLHVVHNYISLNKYIIKLQYPVYWLEKTIDMVIKLDFKVFFSSDIINSYWIILIKESNCNKIGFLISNGQ